MEHTAFLSVKPSDYGRFWAEIHHFERETSDSGRLWADFGPFDAGGECFGELGLLNDDYRCTVTALAGRMTDGVDTECYVLPKAGEHTPSQLLL